MISDQLSFERHTLEKIKFGLGMSVTNTARLEVTEDYIRDQMMYRLSVDILGKRIKESILETVTVPINWWQHLKRQWFPEWLLCRYPVKVRSISTRVNHYHICPHLNIVTESSHLEFCVMKDCMEVPNEN